MRKKKGQYDMSKLCILLILGLGVLRHDVCAQQPFSLEQVTTLLKSGVGETEIKKQIEQYKVNFELTTETMRALIRAGASDQLLRIIETNPYKDLAITSPNSDEDVGGNLRVSGRSKTFPGKHLWLFVQRKGLSVWWPQGGEIEVEGNGEWDQGVLVGQPHDISFKFNIVAIWVDEVAHKDLTSYMQRGEKDGKFPGIRLPNGAPSIQVTVRKASH